MYFLEYISIYVIINYRINCSDSQEYHFNFFTWLLQVDIQLTVTLFCHHFLLFLYLFSLYFNFQCYHLMYIILSFINFASYCFINFLYLFNHSLIPSTIFDCLVVFVCIYFSLNFLLCSLYNSGRAVVLAISVMIVNNSFVVPKVSPERIAWCWNFKWRLQQKLQTL
jgi:hypothetical protein